MTHIAVILAGGSGKRLGGDRPKQLLPLADGRTILEHAIDAFRACAYIYKVLVIMHPDYVEDTRRFLSANGLNSDSCEVIAGGKERWESSWNAIRWVAEHESADEVSILLHDAARPFVSERIISDVCEALIQSPAVTVAVPATDTMYRVETPQVSRRSPAGRQGVDKESARGRQVLVEIPDRATMMRAQTPQAFHLDVIKEAFELALQDPNMRVTDDCSVVHQYLPQVPIAIVEGEEANRKITYKQDLLC